MGRSQGRSAAGRIASNEKTNDIGNRTRDLPACSIVPQASTLSCFMRMYHYLECRGKLVKEHPSYPKRHRITTHEIPWPLRLNYGLSMRESVQVEYGIIYAILSDDDSSGDCVLVSGRITAE
jgi:hypothetical protein